MPASGYAALVPDADPVLTAEPLAAPPLDADPLPAADPLPPPEPLVDPVHKLEPVPGPVPEGVPGEEAPPITPGEIPGGVTPGPDEVPPPEPAPPPGDFPSTLLCPGVALEPQPMRPNKAMPEAKAMIALRIATSKSRSRAVANYWKSKRSACAIECATGQISDSRIRAPSENRPPMGRQRARRNRPVSPRHRLGLYREERSLGDIQGVGGDALETLGDRQRAHGGCRVRRTLGNQADAIA